jgi:hypothetical protein
VWNEVKTGYRLACPPGCPKEIYENLMLRCWREERSTRPTFDDLVEYLEARVSVDNRTHNMEDFQPRLKSRSTLGFEPPSPQKQSAGGFVSQFNRTPEYFEGYLQLGINAANTPPGLMGDYDSPSYPTMSSVSKISNIGLPAPQSIHSPPALTTTELADSFGDDYLPLVSQDGSLIHSFTPLEPGVMFSKNTPQPQRDAYVTLHDPVADAYVTLRDPPLKETK